MTVNIDWNEQNIKTLETMWHAGEPLGTIAVAISGSVRARNAVIGKAHRMKLGPHPHPQKPGINPMDRAGKRHGNADKPSTELVRKARDRGPDGTTPSDSRYLRSDVWNPLPGIEPVGLMERIGCAWPVTEAAPHLFCNHPKSGKSPYCDIHLKRYKTKETTE